MPYNTLCEQYGKEYNVNTNNTVKNKSVVVTEQQNIKQEKG